MARFGKYTVVDLIGEGGLGKVFRGWDPDLKRDVAIKVCSFDDEHFRERFVQEAEIAASLSHGNIVTVFGFGWEEGEPYLVQEYLEGEDLDEVIRRGDALPLATRLRYLIEIAKGLRHSHERGVVHRDVKPANVRIETSDRVRIMDFGIAKLVATERGLTRTGMRLGTDAYVSPEVLDEESVDHRTDIFSYGVLAYELMAGERPFKGDTVSKLYYQIIHVDPPSIMDIVPTCTPETDAIIRRCLAKDVEDRYQSFDEVVQDLEIVRAAVTTGSGGKIGLSIPPSASPLLKRLGIAAVALVVLAGVTFASVRVLGLSGDDSAAAFAEFPESNGPPQLTGPSEFQSILIVQGLPSDAVATLDGEIALSGLDTLQVLSGQPEDHEIQVRAPEGFRDTTILVTLRPAEIVSMSIALDRLAEERRDDSRDDDNVTPPVTPDRHAALQTPLAAIAQFAESQYANGTLPQTLGGTVTVRITVGASGNAEAVSILDSGGSAPLAVAAERVGRLLSFVPAVRDGRRAREEYDLSIDFVATETEEQRDSEGDPRQPDPGPSFDAEAVESSIRAAVDSYVRSIKAADEKAARSAWPDMPDDIMKGFSQLVRIFKSLDASVAWESLQAWEGGGSGTFRLCVRYEDSTGKKSAEWRYGAGFREAGSRMEMFNVGEPRPLGECS